MTMWGDWDTVGRMGDILYQRGSQGVSSLDGGWRVKGWGSGHEKVGVGGQDPSKAWVPKRQLEGSHIPGRSGNPLVAPGEALITRNRICK